MISRRICAGKCVVNPWRDTRNNIGEAFGEAVGDVGRPGRPFGKLSHIDYLFSRPFILR